MEARYAEVLGYIIFFAHDPETKNDFFSRCGGRKNLGAPGFFWLFPRWHIALGGYRHIALGGCTTNTHNFFGTILVKLRSRSRSYTRIQYIYIGIISIPIAITLSLYHFITCNNTHNY